MQKHLLVALLTIGTPTSVSFAADSADSTPAAVQKTLKGAYGTAQTKVVHAMDQNGVKLYESTATTKDGQATAVLTEAGDPIMVGHPVQRTAVPAAVQDVAEGLFQSPSKSINQYTYTYFFVNIQPKATAGGTAPGTYELKFDATGKLLDARSYSQKAELNPGAAVAANDASRHNLADLVQKEYAGTTATDVHSFPAAPNHYVVSVQKNKQPGWVIMDQMGTFYASRLPIETGQLPAAVQKTLSTDFKADNIKSALRGDVRLYGVDQNVGGEQISLLVHPNGDVMEVQSKSQGGVAGAVIEAAHRQVGGK